MSIQAVFGGHDSHLCVPINPPLDLDPAATNQIWKTSRVLLVAQRNWWIFTPGIGLFLACEKVPQLGAQCTMAASFRDLSNFSLSANTSNLSPLSLSQGSAAGFKGMEYVEDACDVWDKGSSLLASAELGLRPVGPLGPENKEGTRASDSHFLAFLHGLNSVADGSQGSLAKGKGGEQDCALGLMWSLQPEEKGGDTTSKEIEERLGSAGPNGLLRLSHPFLCSKMACFSMQMEPSLRNLGHKWELMQFTREQPLFRV